LNFFKILFSPITAPIRFIQENFKTFIFLGLIYIIVSNQQVDDLHKANLQVINLTGPIISANKILEQIDQAKTNKHIKGVLFNVNSPGGAVAPSVEIAYAIKELNKLKPVIAYASGIMASGSYYSSIYASKIIANPGSMIGSIGVIMETINGAELLSKIGIKTQVVKMGKYKEIGTPTREWTKDERAELQKVISDTYNMFVSDVQKARSIQKLDRSDFADAHIFTAKEAKKVKLIDEVATLTTAKQELIKLAKVKDPKWLKPNKVDQFMEKLIDGSLNHLFVRLNGLNAY